MKKKCHKCSKGKARRVLGRCSSPGCRNMKAPRSGYCAEHQPTFTRKSRARYHSGLGWFYSSTAWRNFRLVILRENPICMHPDCSEPATDVDHITPIADGGEKFDRKNCQALCHSHHSQKTRAEQLWGASAWVGGGGTCEKTRLLPPVQVKKCVREFWRRGVSDAADSAGIPSESGENGQKTTDMTGGSEAAGGGGDLENGS